MHAEDAPTLLIHVSTPRDDAISSVGDEMDVADWKLEEFQQFCFYIKPLKNHPKVNQHGLQMDLRRAHSQLKPSAFGYSLDEENSDEADDGKDQDSR